jgi:tetratricopeptide (TPR) repeat protein
MIARSPNMHRVILCAVAALAAFGFAAARAQTPGRSVEMCSGGEDEEIPVGPQREPVVRDRTAIADATIARCNALIARQPRNSMAYVNRADAYREKDDYDHAFADYNQAIRLDQRNVFAYVGRGYAWSARNDDDRAIADFTQVIRLDPSLAFAYAMRGLSYGRKRDFVRAISDYDKALAIDPASAEARQGRDRAQQALAAPPRQPAPPAVAEAEHRFNDPPVTPAPSNERRVALVIGNAAYRAGAAALQNPVRDAEAVAAALRQAGFQSVDLAVNLDLAAMTGALHAFRDKADAADWALIYFAGHGMEVEGVNYLLPIDAKLADDRDIKRETVTYEEMMTTIGRARALRIVVLDACRNNPFKAQMRRSEGHRDITPRGLAAPPEPRPGTLVVYSAAAGELADDGAIAGNSPFAHAFADGIRVPGREVRRLFDFVRDDVLSATRDQQHPFTYGSLPAARDFYFTAAR